MSERASLMTSSSVVSGANPLEKNNKGQTARAVAKEKGAKKALIKVLRRAEKMQKRRIEDDPQLSQIRLYDWVFEHQEQLVSRLLEKVFIIRLNDVINMTSKVSDDRFKYFGRKSDKKRALGC